MVDDVGRQVVEEVVVKSKVEINTQIRWHEDLQNPLSPRYKLGMKNIMDFFNDGIDGVASDNGMRFERADVSFHLPEADGKERNIIDLFSGEGPRSMVLIELEFRKINLNTDDLETLNQFLNKNIISVVGDAIRSAKGPLIDTMALAKVETKTAIQIGSQVTVTVPPTHGTNINFTLFTSGNIK